MCSLVWSWTVTPRGPKALPQGLTMISLVWKDSLFMQWPTMLALSGKELLMDLVNLKAF